MGPIGVPELLIILLILVIIFGASKLPQLGKGLGEGITNFKKGLKSDTTADEPSNGDEAKKAHSS